MLRILIIDDEMAIVKVISSALRKAGFEVEFALNGLEGLEKYYSGNFDAVITDGEMPYLGGNEVVQNIRESDRPDTPVIGISGTPWLLSQKDFDFIIPKPFSLKTLFSKIDHIIFSPFLAEKAV